MMADSKGKASAVGRSHVVERIEVLHLSQNILFCRFQRKAK
jgi:hypothetical protein